MSDPSALRTLLDPTSAPPADGWLWPVIVGGLLVCALGIWLMRRPLRAMGEPWGELPRGQMLAGWIAAMCVLFVPLLLAPPLQEGPRPVHAPLQEGLVTVAITAAAIGVLAMLQTLTPPHRRLEWLELKPANLGRTALVYGLAAPSLLALILACVAALRLCGLEVEPQPQVVALTGRREPAWIVGVYVVACIAAPLREEFVFRLVVYGSIAGLANSPRWNHPLRLAAMAVSGGLFVAVHGTWLVGVLPLTLLAWVLAALFAHSRSLWPPVLLHALHNTLVVTLQFFVLGA